MIYKVLSVCQPWAFLLCQGGKNVENRGWATSHRGPLLIHASGGGSKEWKRSLFADQTVLDRIIDRVCESGGSPPEIPDELPIGGIVGRVTLLDCVRGQPGQGTLTSHPVLSNPWYVGPVGWLVADQRPLPFIPMRGKLSIFEVDLPELPTI